MAGSVAIPAVAAAASPEVVLAAGPAATQAVAVASRRCRAVVNPAVPILACQSCGSPPLESPPADIMSASARSWAEMLRCVSWNMVAGAVPWNRASRSFVQRTEVGHERHRHPAGLAGGVPGHAHRHNGTRQGARLRSFRVHLGHRPGGQCCGCRRARRARRRTARRLSRHRYSAGQLDGAVLRRDPERRGHRRLPVPARDQPRRGRLRIRRDHERAPPRGRHLRGHRGQRVHLERSNRSQPAVQHGSVEEHAGRGRDPRAADPYDMHIAWHAPAKLVLDQNGRVISGSGYPHD